MDFRKLMRSQLPPALDSMAAGVPKGWPQRGWVLRPRAVSWVHLIYSVSAALSPHTQSPSSLALATDKWKGAIARTPDLGAGEIILFHLHLGFKNIYCSYIYILNADVFIFLLIEWIEWITSPKIKFWNSEQMYHNGNIWGWRNQFLNIYPRSFLP